MAASLDYPSMNRDDHNYLAGMGRDLALALTRSPADRGDAMRMLGLFRSSLLLHFLQEEEVMQEANYPGFFLHKFSHEALTARLTALQSCYAAGRKASVAAAWPAVQAGLHSHLDRYDVPLVAFFERG